MTNKLNNEIPDYASSFSELARLLRINRGQLREIRDADSRFPQQSPEGWPVVQAGLFLELRRVEKMRDEVFYFEKRDEALATLQAIDAGDLNITDWPSGMKNRFRRILQATIEGRGASREEHISDLACHGDGRKTNRPTGRKGADK